MQQVLNLHECEITLRRYLFSPMCVSLSICEQDYAETEERNCIEHGRLCSMNKHFELINFGKNAREQMARVRI